MQPMYIYIYTNVFNDPSKRVQDAMLGTSMVVYGLKSHRMNHGIVYFSVGNSRITLPCIIFRYCVHRSRWDSQTQASGVFETAGK